MQEFADFLGLTMPVLLDRDGSVIDSYTRYIGDDEFSTAYPQEWLLDAEGTIIYFSNHFESDELTALVEQELAD